MRTIEMKAKYNFFKKGIKISLPNNGKFPLLMLEIVGEMELSISKINIKDKMFEVFMEKCSPEQGFEIVYYLNNN